MPVIGVLNTTSREFVAPGGPDAPLFAAFYRGLNEAGYFEGRNITLLFQGADYHYDRLPALAADLVDQRVAVIFATAPTSVPKAAQAATDTIPMCSSPTLIPSRRSCCKPQPTRRQYHWCGLSD